MKISAERKGEERRKLTIHHKPYRQGNLVEIHKGLLRRKQPERQLNAILPHSISDNFITN